MTMSTAGHDTTAATTASTMAVLAENPGLLARLKNEPKLIPRFIEESIRWASPAQHFIRSAPRDCEISGGKIANGDLIWSISLTSRATATKTSLPILSPSNRTASPTAISV